MVGLGLDLLRRRGAGTSVAIFIFHRVLDAPDPLGQGDPDRARFRTMLAWLREWFDVLPLREAIERLDSRSLPARAAAITFDDGYADNVDNALPELQAAGVSATFFIASGFLDGGRMWNDSVIEAIRAAPSGVLDLHAAGLGAFPLRTNSERLNAIRSILYGIKHLPPSERQRRVDAIVQAIGVDLPDDLMMTSAQVRQLHAAGMTIGGHTVSHPILASTADDAARAEICRGKEQLEGIIGESLQFFAYPNGVPGRDYKAQHVHFVREAGFKAAVSTAWGMARTNADRFQMPRFTPWQQSRVAFGLELVRNSFRTPTFAEEGHD